MSAGQPTSMIKQLSATLVVFLVILLARWEVLTEPPYWDAVLGPWTEADVIAGKRFDLWQHWWNEPGWKAGGQTAYRFSVIPTFIAALMTWLPTPTATFVVYRLLIFLAAAGIAVLMFELLRRRVAMVPALAASLALMTSPVFCTQIDMLAMEIPIALVATLALRAVDGNRLATAAGILALGLFLKVTVIVLIMALVCLLVVLAFHPDSTLRPRVDRGLGTVSAALVLGLVMIFRDAGGMLSFMPAIFVFMTLWTPDLMMLAVVGIAGSLMWLLAPIRRGWQSVLDRVADQPALAFALIGVAGTGASYVIITGLPRYLTFVIPLLFYLVTVLFARTPGLKRVLTPAMLALTVFHLANWNGRFYPSEDFIARIVHGRPTDACRTEGSLLERTHAYLADHRANQRMVAEFEAEWDGAPVLANLPFADFLSRPSLGYVRQPMSGYLTGAFHLERGTFRDVAKILIDRPREIWCLYSRNMFSQHLSRFYIPPPPGQKEGPIDVPAQFYKLGFDAGELSSPTNNWYFQHVGPHPEHLPHYPPRFSDRDVILEETLHRIDHDDWFRYDQRRQAGHPSPSFGPGSPSENLNRN